jgi:hypothetical protein
MRLCRHSALHLLVAGLCWVSVGTARADDRRESTIGMPVRIDQLVLPGSELEVKPLDDRKSPVVLRIANTYAHGTSFRYDLVYYALEPGKFDLKNYLRRKDGSSTADLPPLLVTIRPLLPAGQIEPHPLELGQSPRLGGYSTLVTIIGGLWALALIGMVAFFLFGARTTRSGNAARAKPQTLAERLRPLVEKAMAGELPAAECAELERSLLAYWRKRLGLDDEAPARAIARMRGHPEAGLLLDQLEFWLHRPGTATTVDVAILLRPYQNLPADALDPAERQHALQESENLARQSR